MAVSTPLNSDEIKIKIARMCGLCQALWPDEWPGKFTDTRENFRDWLNTKTSLNEDHITDLSGALIAWVAALEAM